MSMRHKQRVSAGLTLTELLIVLAVLVVLIAILYPVFASARHKSQDYSCLSNEKQIGLAMLQYIQDNDGRFPPQRMLHIVSDSHAFAGGTWENSTMPYVKSKGVFQCPDAPTFDEANPSPSYRYNDFVAGADSSSEKVFANLTKTVLIMDGDLTSDDVGHAWTPESAPLPAQFGEGHKCLHGQSATVQNAPLRHHGGANYAFADGHARFLRPGQVFFPPRASTNLSHENVDGIPIGPDPAGNMTFAGTTYAATFHLR